MSTRKYITNLVVITCIVERGEGDSIVDAAKKAGATAATIFFARGTGIREKLGLLGIAIQPEKEIIEIVIDKEHADGVFDAMADAGQLHLPGKGFIYMTECMKALTYLGAEKT
jgi:nitrogen regulatory protein P-II 1